MSHKKPRPQTGKDDDGEGGLSCCNEESREVYLIGAVTSAAMGAVIMALRQLDRKKGTITLVIASSGGSEGAGWAIADAVALCKNPVIGLAYGECQSIAVLILQACKTRLLSPGCRVMVHNGSVEMDVTVSQLRTMSAEAELLTQHYYQVLAARSGLSVKKVNALCDAESYFSAQQTVDMGLADGILSKPSRRKR